jgi:diaminopimelate epimerase
VSTIRVSKLHGAGNDFLVGVGSEPPAAETAAALCDRHRGIGADGLITVLPGSDGADCSMVLANSDGSRAEMSGNGIRCLAWVAHRHGLGDGRQLMVDTDAGRRAVMLQLDEDGDVAAATVDMGAATFEPGDIPLRAPSPFDLEVTYHGVTYDGDAVGIGNPHLVLFVDDVPHARVVQHGPHLETDDRFPNRTNVEFVAISGPDELTMRVWERGVGETLSCGTGVCAAAAAAHRRALVGDRVRVRVPGGEHEVELGETVCLAGPVAHVFDAEVDVG